MKKYYYYIHYDFISKDNYDGKGYVQCSLFKKILTNFNFPYFVLNFTDYYFENLEDAKIKMKEIIDNDNKKYSEVFKRIAKEKIRKQKYEHSGIFIFSKDEEK